MDLTNSIASEIRYDVKARTCREMGNENYSSMQIIARIMLFKLLLPGPGYTYTSNDS